MNELKQLAKQASPYQILKQYDNSRMSVIVILISSMLMILANKSYDEQNYLAFILLKRQDIFVICAVLIAALLKPHIYDVESDKKWSDYFSRPLILVLFACFLIAVCRIGYHFVFFDRDLSGDEQMANFDAQIFAHGRFFEALPSFWRPFALALTNDMFILPIGDHEAWVSAYLPINAAMRTAVGMAVDRSFTSPLLVGVGFLALWRVSGRLWPDSPSARTATLLLFAGSSQIIVAGMTAFATTGHLALNLLWLALFLENRRATHIGAVIVGFLATGLHQPLFHPLFVLPFIGLIAAQGRWRLLAFYGISYALISAFWLAWPIWISSHGAGAIPPHSAVDVSFLDRLINVVGAPNLRGLTLMAANLLRFAAWQHLLLLPLLAFGITVTWRGDPLARALAIGFLLPIPVMFILLPYQGNAWGYRYLHGVIGNACLLGGYGWRALEAQGLSLRGALRQTSLATFLVIIPAHAYMARQWAAPFAQVATAITASKAAIVIVADDTTSFGIDLLTNRPDLSNRPIRLAASQLVPSDMRALCGFGSVSFYGPAQMRRIDEFLLGQAGKMSDRFVALADEARRLDCVVVPPAQDVGGS
jgi:hypothetical protein